MFQLLLLLLPLTDGPLFGIYTAPPLLTVSVTGLKSDRGLCCVALYRSKAGFPSKPDQAYQLRFVPIRAQKATLELADLPPGEYAVAAYHDENGNREMDTNFVGIPREGYAASNNPTAPFGPPSFAQASFRLATAPTRLELRMRY